MKRKKKATHKYSAVLFTIKSYRKPVYELRVLHGNRMVERKGSEGMKQMTRNCTVLCQTMKIMALMTILAIHTCLRYSSESYRAYLLPKS